MKIIYPEQLKQNLIQKLYSCYVFLGEDLLLINKSQDLIIKFSNAKGFIEKTIIHIKKDQDWNQVINFYKKNNLFFKKTILIINFVMNHINPVLIKNITKICFVYNQDIIVLLKFNQLSILIKKNKLLHQFKAFGSIIYCFALHNLFFTNWLKYEIQEKNINIEKKAYLFLCEHYEGHTLFVYKILEMLSIIWSDTLVTLENIKKIITDFSVFSPSHWISAIFQNKKKSFIYFKNFV